MSVPSAPSSSNPRLASNVPPPGHEYHPEFSCTTTSATYFDVVIVSSDGVHFVVSANLLKSTSTIFGDALSQKFLVNLNDLEASTISILLKMLTGKELPVLGDLEVIEPLLFAAEKYGMDGPLSMMRNILKAQCYEDPLRLYGIGCYFEWEEIISLASRRSLDKTDIFSEQSRAALLKVNNANVLPGHILAIQNLHQDRIDEVTDQALWAPDGPILRPWGTKRCRIWYKFKELRDFQIVISTRIKESPAGHFISDKNFSGSCTAAVDLGNAYCNKCERAHVNVDRILGILRERLQRCPQEIRLDMMDDMSGQL